MIRDAEDGTKIITLDLPQREGKEGYIGTIFSLYLRFGAILSDPGFKETDARIFYMTKFMINLIPGRKNRTKIKDMMKTDIDKAIEKLVSNDEKNKKRNEICIDYIGEIHDFVDKHLGVSEENRVGIVAPPRYIPQPVEYKPIIDNKPFAEAK